MQKTHSNQGSGILYNPYLDRSRASSKASINDRSIVEKESISGDSADMPQKIEPKVSVKTKNQVETKTPPVLKDEREPRPGFFSNMNHLMEIRRTAQASISRGNTLTRATKKEHTNSNQNNKFAPRKSESKVNASISDVKISMKDFMDNIVTQKKLNHSKLTARKFSSPTSNTLAGSSLKVSPTGPRESQSREKSFNNQLVFGFKVNKQELSSMAHDLSSNPLFNTSRLRKVNCEGIF